MATETVSIVIKAFDQTQKALRGIQAAFGKLSKVFFNFKTALVSAVGAAGLGLLVSNSLKATDALAKTAGKIGTTTEALSALQFAGQLTGVEVNTMNMALQRFTRRASEAAVGTGEAKGALRELNVDARSLVRLPLDERMLVLADAFEGVESEADRLRLAFKLFDSEGAALVNTLGQGREGLAGMLGEARALGVVMSSKAAAGVEEANDQFFRLQSLFGGIIKQTVAGLAPALAAFSELITSKVKAGIEGTSGSVVEFGKELAGRFLDGIENALIGLQDLLNGFVSIANFVSDFQVRINQAFGNDAVDTFTEKLKIQQAQLANLTRENKKFTDMGQAGPYDKQIADIEQVIAGLEASIQKAQEAQGTFGSFERFTFATDAAATFDMLRAATDNVSASVDNLSSKASETLPTAFDSFMTNLKRTRELAGELTPQLEKLGDQAITGLGKAFTDAITGAQKFSDAIKNMAKSVIDSLIQMLIQKYIVDAAFGFITSALGGGTTSATTGGGGGSALPTFANGGVATGGRPAIVGEKGPELFIPSSTGRVVPNDQLGGGGVTVVQHINVTTGVQQTVRAEIANLLPQISNAAKSAVADARMRGGSFSKAMGTA